MFFNTMTVSRYKLINLLNATKKNEKVKMKNPIVSILIFIVATALLGFAYWKVTADANSMETAEKMLPPIVKGIGRYSIDILVFIRFYTTSSSNEEKGLFKRYQYVCIKTN